MKIRTAVILCGGKGTRLGNLGKKLPKTLVKVQGKPIIWYIINTLKKYKFNHFILPLGYKGHKIKKYLKNIFFYNTNIEYVNTGINSNIGKRIYKIKNKILSKNFLLLNGDAIFKFNLNKIFLEHEKNNHNALFEHRAPNFFIRFFSMSSSTQKMFGEIENSFTEIIGAEEFSSIKCEFNITSHSF